MPHKQCLEIPPAEPSDSASAITSEEDTPRNDMIHFQQVTRTAKHFVSNWWQLTHNNFVLNLRKVIKFNFILPTL